MCNQSIIIPIILTILFACIYSGKLLAKLSEKVEGKNQSHMMSQVGIEYVPSVGYTDQQCHNMNFQGLYNVSVSSV